MAALGIVFLIVHRTTIKEKHYSGTCHALVIMKSIIGDVHSQ